MPNALDAFRAQKEAADQVHERLTEVAKLVNRLRVEVDGIVTKELRERCEKSSCWLTQAQETREQVRWAREQEVARYWPSIWRRWTIAIVFALAATAAAGAGYGWVTEPYSAEIADLRQRADFGDEVMRRMVAMTPNERRQLDGLLKTPVRR